MMMMMMILNVNWQQLVEEGGEGGVRISCRALDERI